ncbi:MAG: CvpA family protein [Clostridium sp.]
MENWLSIAAGIFLAIMILYGHYKGFIRLAVSATALIVTLFIVQTAMPQVTGFLKHNTGIAHAFEAGTKKTAGLNDETEIEQPAEQRSLIENLSLPGQLKKALLENNNNETYRILGVKTFNEYVTGYLSNSIINIVGFLILFAIVFAALHIIVKWMDLVARLPIICGINKLAGAALGAAEGIFFLWLLCFLVTALSGTHIGRILIAQIESSTWLSFLYNHNMLSSIVILAVKNIL